MGVLLHLASDRGINLVPHGTLAIDFFFVPLGFVIAAAYRRRLVAGWALGDFLTVRDHPPAFLPFAAIADRHVREGLQRGRAARRTGPAAS